MSNEPTPEYEIMSRIDATWLRVESPSTPFLIHGMLRIAPPAQAEDILALLHKRLPQIPRLRQRPEDGAPRLGGWWHGEARWVTDTEFSISRHTYLHPSINEQDFPTALNTLQSQPLDFRHPPWEAHLFPLNGGGVRLLFRIHHCIGDGVAMGKLLQVIADPPPPSFLLPTFPPLSALRKIAFWTIAGIRRPLSLLRLICLPPAERKIFLTPSNGIRIGAWTTPALPLAPVFRMRERVRATISEILTAVLCETLYRDALSRKQIPDKAVIRAAMTINLRDSSEKDIFNNRFGLAYLRLPLASMGFDDRLTLVHKRMLRRKRAQQAPAFLDMLRHVGTIGPKLHGWATRLLTSKASIVLSHVRGPDQAIALGGSPVDEIAFFAPQSGSLGMSVSVLTYAGKITVGFHAAPTCHPDPEALAKRFTAVFHEVLGR